MAEWVFKFEIRTFFNEKTKLWEAWDERGQKMTDGPDLDDVRKRAKMNALYAAVGEFDTEQKEIVDAITIYFPVIETDEAKKEEPSPIGTIEVKNVISEPLPVDGAVKG